MIKNMVKKVLISTINWNKWEDTIECIESMLKLDYKNFQIYILDNHSTNESLEKIEKYLNREIEPHIPELDEVKQYVLPVGKEKISHVTIEEPELTTTFVEKNTATVTIVKNKENYGYGPAHNQMLRIGRKVSFDNYVWVINNDVVVARDSLTKLVAALESDEKVAYVGSIFPYYHEPSIMQCAGGAKFYPQFGFGKHFKKNAPIEIANSITQEEINTEVNFLPGTALLFKKDALKDISGFDDDFFMYAEDVDLAFRTREKGWTYKIALDSLVYHKERKSTSNRKQWFFEIFHEGTSIFLRKHFSPFIFLIAIPAMIVHSFKMSFSFKNTGYTIKGIYRGLRRTLRNNL